MDFLQLVWLEYPGLQKVIRTQHLPIGLALSPRSLLSVLALAKKLGISLDYFPHFISDVYDQSGSQFVVATFEDDGPFISGSVNYVLDYVQPPDEGCGYCAACDYGQQCTSAPPAVRHMIDFGPDFMQISEQCMNDNDKRLASLQVEIPGFEDDKSTPLARYSASVHGRVLVCEKTEESLEHDKGVTANITFPTPTFEECTILSDTTVSTVYSELMSDNKSCNSISTLDETSNSSVAWKKRIGNGHINS